MMRVIVGTPPPQNLSSKKVPAYRQAGSGSPVSPQAASGPDHFLQKDFGAATPEDLEWEKLSIEELLAVATTQSLMGDIEIFRLSGALSGARSQEFLDAAPELAASPHEFIFTEEKLLKKATDALAKAGAKLTVHAPVKKEEAFNMFSLTYAFAARDRKKLWLLFQEALRRGIVPEAAAGMLHYKIRDMLGKGERVKFSKEELVSLSRTLVAVYHDSHRGAGELSLLLERFILLL